MEYFAFGKKTRVFFRRPFFYVITNHTRIISSNFQEQRRLAQERNRALLSAINPEAPDRKEKALKEMRDESAKAFEKAIRRAEAQERRDEATAEKQFAKFYRILPIVARPLVAPPGTVPFGKYKAQAVEDLLVDRKYCRWLLRQDFFPKEHPALCARVKEAEATPILAPAKNPVCAQPAAAVEVKEEKEELAWPDFNPYRERLALELKQAGELYTMLSQYDLTMLNAEEMATWTAVCNGLRAIRSVLEALPEKPTVDEEADAYRRIAPILHSPGGLFF